MRRLIVLLGALAIVIVACMPQGQCSPPQFTEICQTTDALCQGHLIDAHTWESGPITGNWLDFGREKTIRIHLRDGQTGQPLQGDFADFNGFVSASARPNDSGNQFAPCAGNLCEANITTDSNGLLVADFINDTCADYFFYVVVRSAPSADASGDAQTE